MGLLSGKKGLIMGVANERSIAVGFIPREGSSSQTTQVHLQTISGLKTKGCWMRAHRRAGFCLVVCWSETSSG